MKRDFIKLPSGSLYFADNNAGDELALMSVAVGGELVAAITPRGTASTGMIWVRDEHDCDDRGDACGWLYTIGRDGFDYGPRCELEALAPDEEAA